MSIKNRPIRTRIDRGIAERRNIPEPFRHRLNQHLAVPCNGALRPDPVIRERVIRRMNLKKASKKHPLHALTRLFEIRIPAYHAALCLAVFICALVITDRVLDRNGVAYNHTVGASMPVAQIDAASTRLEAPQPSGPAFADSLAQYRVSRSDTFFIGHTDSL